MPIVECELPLHPTTFKPTKQKMIASTEMHPIEGNIKPVLSA
jgi:hypothetical protein